MLNRLGGDRQLLRQLLEIFLHDCCRDIAKLEKGLKNRDYEGLDFIAHGLKGELGNLGFMPGYKIALELETLIKTGTFPLPLPN